MCILLFCMLWGRFSFYWVAVFSLDMRICTGSYLLCFYVTGTSALFSRGTEGRGRRSGSGKEVRWGEGTVEGGETVVRCNI